MFDKLWHSDFRCLFDEAPLGMVMGTLYIGYGAAVEMCWCSKSTASESVFRPVGWLAPRSHYNKITAYTGVRKVLLQGEKMWMQRKPKGCSRSLSKPPCLSLSLSSLAYLRLQASRPLQQRPWSTTPPAWSSHIPRDYNIESRKMLRTRPEEGKKKRKNRAAENDGEDPKWIC